MALLDRFLSIVELYFVAENQVTLKTKIAHKFIKTNAATDVLLVNRQSEIANI